MVQERTSSVSPFLLRTFFHFGKKALITLVCVPHMYELVKMAFLALKLYPVEKYLLLLRPIYTVRLCRMRQAYDRPTT